jgi:predicted HicB family RNase H-like nuclease
MSDIILTPQEDMKRLTIRLSDDLHNQLVALAEQNKRSVNKEVAWLIEQATKGSKKGKGQ